MRQPRGSVSPMAFVLSGWFVLGAIGYVLALTTSSDSRIDQDMNLAKWWLIVLLVLGVVALVDAVRLGMRGDLRGLARSALLVKLCAIPFFVANFAFLGAVGFVAFGFGAGWAVPLLWIFTWLLIVAGAWYSLVGAVLLVRQRVAPTSAAVLIGLAQFFFVLDVVATVVLWLAATGRRSPIPRTRRPVMAPYPSPKQPRD